MAVNQNVIPLLSIGFDPSCSFVEMLTDGLFKRVLDDDDLVIRHGHCHVNSLIKQNIRSDIQVSTAFIACLFNKSCFIVLTTSPRYRAPIVGVDSKMQFRFSSRLLLTTTGATNPDWYIEPWWERMFEFPSIFTTKYDLF